MKGADTTMPPDGKWPHDWLDIYSKWMTDGFQP
jgi:hypothetical protein